MNWNDFLRRPRIEAGRGSATYHTGKTILVAGAGGSIGSHLARRLISTQPRRLILLDRSEHDLYQIHAELSAEFSPAHLTALLADICDASAMDELLANSRPDIVYHAAAFKHVPILERNPFAALRNNALGSWLFARACVRAGVPRMIALSTDKAAGPASVLGASKRIAELALLRLSDSCTRITSLRLGNVLGSRGSVVPLFEKQIAAGGPVTVTHPEARRFFLTLDESVELLLAAALVPGGGNLFVPELGESVSISTLAEFLIRLAGFTPGKEIALAYTGLRPGDKLTEDLIAADERRMEAVGSSLYRVATPAPPAREFDQWLAELQQTVERRDGSAVLEVLSRILPDYRPSETLRLALEHRGHEVHA
jgi:FlaA1/EpsC-like NDP-sugar epimerase